MLLHAVHQFFLSLDTNMGARIYLLLAVSSIVLDIVTSSWYPRAREVYTVYSRILYTERPKKGVILGHISHKIHQKWKNLGCFGIFSIKCFMIGTKPFKIDGMMTQENKLEVGNLLCKMGKISCNE